MKNLKPILLIATNYLRTQRLTVLIMVVYLGGMAAVFFPNQRSQEARFFLQLHSFYVVFVAMIVAVPAIYAERKSRRIVAVLSKGIHRWEYVAGILSGCGFISGIFCLLVGGISFMLGIRGGYPLTGLGGLVLGLFACALMASAIGLFFGTFLHPLLATAGASATLAFPFILKQAGLSLSDRFFPAAWMARSLVNFQFGETATSRELPIVLTVAIGLTLLFWIAATIVFARRDVTISPE
jgi:ABC-type transport system involved in multi-copper enzyme maturation permease subunit